MADLAWEEYEDRALLPAYAAQIEDTIVKVYHPRRDQDHWHVMIWDEDDPYNLIDCTEGGNGWDELEPAKLYAARRMKDLFPDSQQ